MNMNVDGWNGKFTLTMQSNVRYALAEFSELDAYMWSAHYREAPDFVRTAVAVAWHKSKEALALHRGCISQFCEPWFDASAFQTLPLCPKCGAEDSMEHFRVRVPDAPLDADWDECAVCGYKTDPE